jgi:hypothetical protein
MRTLMAISAPKRDWDYLLSLVPEELRDRYPMRPGVCTECGQDVVMDEEDALAACDRGWPWVCIECLAKRAQTPYRAPGAA